MPQKSDVKGSKTSKIVGKCQKLSDVIYGRSPIRWPDLFIRDRYIVGYLDMRMVANVSGH